MGESRARGGDKAGVTGVATWSTAVWIAQTEGAKFWLSVVTELKTRGVEDIFIACVDGLKGFPEAIEVVYP